MAEQKHTPGPWSRSYEETYHLFKYPPVHCISMCEDGSGGVVAIVPRFLPAHEANACLITVAPELLEVCKTAVGFCVALRQDHACWADHQDAGLLFAMATTALAKLKGPQ